MLENWLVNKKFIYAREAFHSQYPGPDSRKIENTRWLLAWVIYLSLSPWHKDEKIYIRQSQSFDYLSILFKFRNPTSLPTTNWEYTVLWKSNANEMREFCSLFSRFFARKFVLKFKPNFATFQNKGRFFLNFRCLSDKSRYFASQDTKFR